MEFKLDTKAATAADQIAGRIDETGKYIGAIVHAFGFTTDKGTQGVEIAFKDDSGKQADYLRLYTAKAGGEPLSGYRTLQALMTCLSLRGLQSQRGTIKLFDSQTKQREDFDVDLFPELTGKRVGFLLQHEEYEKRDGGIGAQMNVYAVFQADTELTASEVLGRKTSPELLGKMVATLRDKPLRSAAGAGARGKPAASQPAAQQRQAATSSTGFDDMDDDIPF